MGVSALWQIGTAKAQSVWEQRQSNTSSSLLCVTYGKGLFIAGAANGGIVTSPDGVTWTPRTSATSDRVRSLTYGNNLFVAGISDIDHPFMVSSDGVSWGLRAIADPNGSATTSAASYGVAYGGNRYVGVGTYPHSVAHSANALNWFTANGSNAVPGFPGNANGLTFGNGYFFACHSGGKISRSTNGLSWTVPAASGDPNEVMWGIAYGNGMVVAVGNKRIFTSTDGGNSFSAAANPTRGSYTAYFNGVTFGNGTFVAVDNNGVIYSSTDGFNWIWRGNYANGDAFRGVGFGGDTFVAVGDAVAPQSAYIYSSFSSPTTETISSPSTPSGPSTGSTGSSYTYSSGGSTSNLGHSVQYQFDWGDGSTSGWLGVGTTNSSHIWAVAGTYAVKVQARCSTHNSAISNFSSAISVNIGFVPSTVPIANGAVIGLVANVNGLYVTAENAGGSPLIANRSGLGAWEQFQIIDLGNGTVALRSLVNGRFVCADHGGNSPLIANRDTPGPWEQFRLQDAGGGNFVIIARANGKYVCAEDGGKSSLRASRTTAGSWEQFRMVFMPSVKPVNVIASFQSTASGAYVCAENGGAAPLAANRPSAGAWEQFQLIDLGGSIVAIRALINGKFITADNYGSSPLIANRSNPSTWEQFQLLDAGGGNVALRALVNGRYVSTGNTGSQLIANRLFVGPTEQFMLNVSLRAVVNNRFVTAANSGNSPLIASRPSIGLAEQFQLVNTSAGYFALKAKVNGMYVCANNYGNDPLIANRTGIGLWEQFQWIAGGNGNIALRAAVNGLFVCAENGGNSPLIANRPSAGNWEQFR
jgi:hypothetical protein